jgi:hypothetical protein
MLFDNDTFERGGRTFRVNFPHDSDHGAPWEECDGHGPVSEWRRHREGMGSKPPKAPGEMILHWDRGSYRTYDFAEAVRIAKRDGWDTAPYGEGTRGERAARAAMADFNRLRQWCSDQWHYVGVEVTALDSDGDATHESESVWGIESDCYSYLEDTAHELADDILSRLNAAMAADIEASRPDMAPAY